MKYRKFLVVFLLAGIFIFVAFSEVHETITARLEIDQSALGRLQLAELGWQLFKASPIWGHGLGSYPIVSRALWPTSIKAEGSHGVEMGLSPHNEYVRYLAEEGIFGITSFVFLLFSALRLSVQIYKSSFNVTVKNYGLFSISIVLILIFYSITDHAFEYASLYFWVFMGIGENYLRKQQILSQYI